MQLNEFVDIKGLSLITSCGCNLQCSYCRIAESVNSDSARLQKETIQALQDGTFLNNVKESLFRIHQSPAKITNIAFWGQEPTLTLHHITEHLDEWMAAFCNVDNIMFSTNSMAYGDRVIDFLKTLDQVIDHHIQVNIQFSWDGDESTDEIRLADSSAIYKNITNIVEACNLLSFKNIEVFFNFHGVISLDLLSRLTTAEKVANYYKNLCLWGSHFHELNNNPRVHLPPDVGLALENPIDASTMDGIHLANFVRMSQQIDRFYFKDIGYYNYGNSHIDTLFNQYITQFTNILNWARHEFGVHSFEELIDQMAMDLTIYKKVCNHCNSVLYCSNGISELKLMYDGTCINCQNSIFDRDLQFLSDEDTLRNQVKKTLASRDYFINLLTDSDEVLMKYFDLFTQTKISCFAHSFKSVLNLMMFLIENKQISLIYSNYNKLLVAAFQVALCNCCHYNNQMTTGSMFLRHTGQIRFFCNGFLELINENMQNHRGGLS